MTTRSIPKWFIRSLEGNFGQAYHIFLEFKIPSGRQVDALILSSKGAHCLEVKNKRYVEAKVNGAWRYRLRETGEIVNDNEHENPYQQATNTAKSFQEWMSKPEQVKAVFSGPSEDPRLKRVSRSNLLEHLKVFPAVVIPDRSIAKLEVDIWCRLFQGEVTPRDLERKNWKERFRLSVEEIQRIAKQLGLKEAFCAQSPSRAARIRVSPGFDHQQYSEDLIAEIDGHDFLLDHYVPNRLRRPSSLLDDPPTLVPPDTQHLLDALIPGKRFVIQAAGGLGKSTLCHFLCREFAKRRIKDPAVAPLPVLIQLRAYRSLAGGLRQLFRNAILPQRLADEIIEEVFRFRKILWCFDGLNEAPHEEKEGICREISLLSKENPWSIIVVTSRASGLPEGFTARFTTCDLEPFSDDQIDSYLSKTGSALAVPEDRRAALYEILRSPLILFLWMKQGGFKVDSGYNIGQLYQKVSLRLLTRELEKRKDSSSPDIYLADLRELASHLGQRTRNHKHELFKSEAVEIIRNHRIEDKLERGYQILETLLATSMVREDERRETISFLHPSFQSFFLASSLLRQPYEEFEEFVNSHTGSTYLVFRPGFWHSVVSGNAEVHECLKFILAIGDQARDSRKYDLLLKRMFEAEPLLLKECFGLLERNEAIARLRDALRFEMDLKEEVQFAFWDRCETWMWKDHEPLGFYPVESTTSNFRALAFWRTLAADEAAFELVKSLKLHELAPEMLAYFCRTMQRGKLPDIEYLDQDDLGGWGQNRFKELLRMCKPDQIATVLLDILETGSPYQKQNAALIFNWHVLKGFGPGMDMLRMQLYDSDGRWSRELTLSDPPPHEIKCGPNQQVVRYDVLDNQPSSLGPECCYYLQYKSWPTHASLGEEVGLILYLVLGIPESRPASSLEGILRALQIFRSVLVTEPLQRAFSSADVALNRDGRICQRWAKWVLCSGYDVGEAQFEEATEKAVDQYLDERSEDMKRYAPYHIQDFFGGDLAAQVRETESQEGRMWISYLSMLEDLRTELHREYLKGRADKDAEEIVRIISQLQEERMHSTRSIDLRNQVLQSGGEQLLRVMNEQTLSFLPLKRDELIAKFFEGFCGFDDSEEIPDLERIAVEWSFFELPKLICRLRAELVSQLSDPIQQIDAATAVARLYLEGLWTQEQAFWQKTLEKVWDEKNHIWELKSSARDELVGSEEAERALSKNPD